MNILKPKDDKNILPTLAQSTDECRRRKRIQLAAEEYLKKNEGKTPWNYAKRKKPKLKSSYKNNEEV